MSPEKATELVFNELSEATAKFGSFNSKHEGYAVVLEEMDELWDEIKKKPHPGRENNIVIEAKQVAAMAVRFLIDCC